MLLLQVYQMMSQSNAALKPVAELTAVMPPGTPEMQRQHLVTTLQTIVAAQLQLNPAQAPAILQTLQQLQQLYDLRATLQTAAAIPAAVPTPAAIPTQPALDLAALALLSGITTQANVPPTAVQSTLPPAAPSKASKNLTQDLMGYGLVKQNNGSARERRPIHDRDRPSFKNPDSLRK